MKKGISILLAGTLAAAILLVFWKASLTNLLPLKSGGHQTTPKTNLEANIQASLETDTQTESKINVEKSVALTFDADMTYGMSKELKNGGIASWYDSKIPEILDKEKVPATMFLTGLWIEAYPRITLELSQNPLFEMANHSYSHRAFTDSCARIGEKITLDEARDEITKTDELLAKNTETYEHYFRFPGLCHDESSVNLAKKLGYVVVDGAISPDSFTNNSDDMLKIVLNKVKPGSIIIFHMEGGSKAAAIDKALSKVIETLRSRGYTFVKVSDLLKNKV